MPSRTSAHQKLATSTPDKATPTHSASSATPVSMTLSTPKRLIRDPVKNEGANMPITCHSITSAAEL